MRVRPIATVVTALMILVVSYAEAQRQPAPAAETSARWSTAVDVTPPQRKTSLGYGGPSFAFGAGGRGLVTWDYQIGRYGHRGSRAAQRGLDGSFGGAQELRPGLGRPLLYGRDHAVALILSSRQRARRVRVAFGSTSGRFGAERTIYRSGPVGYSARSQLAADGSGRIAVVHVVARRDGTDRMLLAQRRPGGRFRRPLVLFDHRGCLPATCPAYAPAGAVAVAVGVRGDIVVAWQGGGFVQARVRRAGRRFGPMVRLGRSYEVKALRAAVSRSGAIWVAWMEHPLASGNGPLTVSLATRPAAARAFRRTQVLQHVRSEGMFDFDGMALALDPGGSPFVAWASSGDGRGTRVRLASTDPRGHRLRIRTLSPPSRSAAMLALATSRRRGEALVVWQHGPNMFEHDGLAAGLISPGRPFGGEEPISDTPRISGAAAAFDPISGAPTVVWQETVGPVGTDVMPSQLQDVLLASTRSAG